MATVACQKQEYTPNPIHTRITQKHYERMQQLIQNSPDNDANYYLQYQDQASDNAAIRYNQTNRNTAMTKKSSIVDNDQSYIPYKPSRKAYTPPASPAYPIDNDSAYAPIAPYSRSYKQNRNTEYPTDNDSVYQLYYD